MTPKSHDPSKWHGQDRREHKRYLKNFILNYFAKDNPGEKFEITQLKNISKGGICFITTREFLPKTFLGIELRTPYISETTYLEGEVKQSHEKVKNMLYETRLEFTKLTPQSEFMISQLIEHFEQGEQRSDNE